MLLSHQFYLPTGRQAEDVERMDSEIRTVGNIDEISADVLEVFDYAALGHIHKPMKVGSEYYCYCGTPLACSVSEAGQKKGIVMVTMKEKGNISTEVLPLPPLRQVRVIKGEFQEVLSQACEDYVTVVLTDKEDLDVIDLKTVCEMHFHICLRSAERGSGEQSTKDRAERSKNWTRLNFAVRFSGKIWMRKNVRCCWM